MVRNAVFLHERKPGSSRRHARFMGGEGRDVFGFQKQSRLGAPRWQQIIVLKSLLRAGPLSFHPWHLHRWSGAPRNRPLAGYAPSKSRWSWVRRQASAPSPRLKRVGQNSLVAPRDKASKQTSNNMVTIPLQRRRAGGRETMDKKGCPKPKSYCAGTAGSRKAPGTN